MNKHRVDEDNFEWYVYENPEVKEIVFHRVRYRHVFGVLLWRLGDASTKLCTRASTPSLRIRY